MSRITKIEGEFMGVKFEVKPTPLNIDEVQEEVAGMMREWYKEHEPEAYDIVTDENTSLETPDDPEEIKEMAGIIKSLNAWKKDVDFRSKYLKTMSNHCMKFNGSVPDDVWERPDIEFSTVKEAWDFFCERRTIQ